MLTPREKFHIQRSGARRRGIPFLLTFDEWWKLWSGSGHWDQRGRGRGRYCMSRPGDQGAYKINNVRICLNDENQTERNRNHPTLSVEHRIKLSAVRRAYWHNLTPEQRAVRLAASIAANKRPVSLATRVKMSLSQKGIPKSPEGRAQIAEANLERYRRTVRNDYLGWE